MNDSTTLTINDKVLLDGGTRCDLVDLKDVHYFETCGNYCKTYYKGGMILINRTLNYLDAKLPKRYFFRANRQYIINLTQISSVQIREQSVYRVVLSCGKEINISRRRSHRFRELLSL
ncbi:MAG: LytR/AlgR family response regulator transcription factor [Balneolaceae bacterium]